MVADLLCVAVGVILCVIGIRNMKGDISTLHSYHRSRVKEEDIKPMGRLVGIGTIICGASVIAYSALLFVTMKTGLDVFTLIGTGVMIAGIAVGLAFNFYAMKKYNGGVF